MLLAYFFNNKSAALLNYLIFLVQENRNSSRTYRFFIFPQTKTESFRIYISFFLSGPAAYL
ncbi:MAG: hypothetical protein ACREUM_01750, partial [Nitrosospira sp.]